MAYLEKPTSWKRRRLYDRRWSQNPRHEVPVVVEAVLKLEFEPGLQHFVGGGFQAHQLVAAAAEVVASRLDVVGNFRNLPGDRALQPVAVGVGSVAHSWPADLASAVEMFVESCQTAVAVEEQEAAGRSLQIELLAVAAETVAAAFDPCLQIAAAAGLKNLRTDLVAGVVAADQRQQSSVADQNLQRFAAAAAAVVVQEEVADQTQQSFAVAAAAAAVAVAEEVAAVQTLQSFAAALSETIRSPPEMQPAVVAAVDSIR